MVCVSEWTLVLKNTRGLCQCMDWIERLALENHLVLTFDCTAHQNCIFTKFVVCCWDISVLYFSKGFYQRFPMYNIWYVNSKSMTYVMLRTYWRQLTNSWRHILQYRSDKTTEADGKWTHNSSVHHGTNILKQNKVAIS